MEFPCIDTVKTGQNIVRMRKDRGLSVRNLQQMLGFSTPQAIYHWQTGAAMPTLDNLVVLANVFHATIDEIIEVANI